MHGRLNRDVPYTFDARPAGLADVLLMCMGTFLAFPIPVLDIKGKGGGRGGGGAMQRSPDL